MLKTMVHPRPFEVADLISFYQSDNVMPKGESEEIAKAASLADYLWKNRQQFRTKSRSFKPPEDTIFRPVAPFNVFSVQEGSDYLTRHKLLAPQNGYGEVQIASSFTMLDEDTAKDKAKRRKMTVHLASGNHLFKLRLKVDDFSLDLIKNHLSNAGIQNFMLGVQDKKNKKKDYDSMTTENEFQKHLHNAWKQKRILELSILTSKRKRRSKNTYDASWEQPRKKIKKESGTSLLRASRKKREKRATKKYEPEPIYERPRTPRTSRRTKKTKKVRLPTPLSPEPVIEAAPTAAEEPDALYQVEMILDDRYNEELQRQEWLVKWEGYTVEESTWEPLENVDGNVKFADYTDAKKEERAALAATSIDVKATTADNPANVSDVWF